MRTSINLRPSEAKAIIGEYIGAPPEAVHFVCKEDGTLSIVIRVETELQPVPLEDPEPTGRTIRQATLDMKTLQPQTFEKDFLQAVYDELRPTTQQ